MGFGWGSAIGKIFDWIPGREESKRNLIDRLKREINELENKPSTPDATRKYATLIRKLHEAEQSLKNR